MEGVIATREAYARHRRLLVLRGAVALIAGALLLVWPRTEAFALMPLLGGFVLLDGLVALVFALALRPAAQHWYLPLAAGVAALLVGLVVFVLPAYLSFLVALWAVLVGAFLLTEAALMRRREAGATSLGVAGLVAIVMGLMLIIANPLPPDAFAWTMGALLLVFGGLIVLAGVELRTAHYQPRT